MSGNTSHVPVTWSERLGGVKFETVHIYAVSGDILREMSGKKNWLGRKVTGRALGEWLESKGCQLDFSGGPALIRRFEDGSAGERYYRNGKLHREDGPADIWHDANGSTVERYYLDGKAVNKENLPPSDTPGATVERPAAKTPNAPSARGPL